ncbi:MAG: hypothetical protein R2690_16030 [Acidimicrobiales bacterium]
MTNNPAKYGGLEGFGLEIVERVPVQSAPNPENIRYLRTKASAWGTCSTASTTSADPHARARRRQRWPRPRAPMAKNLRAAGRPARSRRDRDTCRRRLQALPTT